MCVIQLSGSGYGTTGVPANVTVAGRNCVIIPATRTDSLLDCTLPAGDGANQPIVVTVNGLASAAFTTFGYDPPFLTSVGPLNGN